MSKFVSNVHRVPKVIFSVTDRWLCKNLPRSLRIKWHRRWIRDEEFHPSLDLDLDYVVGLKKDEINKYWTELSTRRAIAHRRGIKTN